LCPRIRSNALTTDPLSRLTETRHDEAARAIKTTFADFTFATSIYSDRGQRTAATDLIGLTTNYEYDSRGRLTAVVLPETFDPETNSRLRACVFVHFP
jgi:YD repeat-containing protein